MKLVYPDYKYHIDFIENTVNIMIIENQVEFRRLVQELGAQSNGEDGRFVLSDNDKTLKISDNVVMIIDPFSISVNNKKILDKIYSKMLTEIETSELYLCKDKINFKLIELLEEVVQKVDYNIEYETEIDFKSIFKLMNVKLEEASEPVEKIVHFMKAYVEILGYKIFIFVNLFSYLSDEELLSIEKYANYNKIRIMFIESNNNRHVFANSKNYVIDKDLCEIY